MAKYIILSVDDEEAILDYYNTIIPQDFEHHCFSNPEIALEFALENQKRLALIISDFKMPEMNGFEFREKLLSGGVDCPFAMVTAFHDKEMAIEGMRLKIVKFLDKPVTDEQILNLISVDAAERIKSLEEDREMITEFLQETKPMLEEIEELILSVEDDPHDMKSINTYFRLLHTIKGTSSCLGLNEISSYAHRYEDLITQVKNNDQKINRKVIDALLEGLDQLKNLYSLAENFEPFPENLEELANIFSQDFSVEAIAKAEEGDAAVKDAPKQQARESKEKEEKITVPESLLANFLELSGELTVIRNTIFKTLLKLQARYTEDKDIEHLSESLAEMQKVSSILQNQISEMKKVDIETVYRPMRRVVRDSCSVLNKKIDFDIKGDNFKIDTSVAKLLNGVLVHLLRNGVDHGIEDAETRENSGKNPVGRVQIDAYETGEEIIVEVCDDGKGLSRELIANKAIEKGLYTQEDLDKMSDQKVYSIIFESGFSTNTEVTSVSGRGVGMDMVKSSLQEFGGKIVTNSTLGEGTTFTMVIPIPRSILIIKSLMVKSEKMQFNIPLDDVDEVVLYDSQKREQEIHQFNGVHILKHHGELCPLVHLGKTLDLSEKDQISDIQNIVIVKGDGYRYGLLVDEIDDIEEIVVKKLSDHFKTPEYLGSTFSDDGALSLIIDCAGVASRHGIENQVEDEMHDRFTGGIEDQKELYEFMKFSLNNMENCALPLDCIYRLEEVDTSRVQFTGERALIRYRGKSLPLVYLEHEIQLTEDSLEDYVKANEGLMNVLVIQVEGKLFGAIIKELNDIATTYEAVETVYSDREGIMGAVTIEEKIISVIDILPIVNRSKGHLSFSNMNSALSQEDGAQRDVA